MPTREEISREILIAKEGAQDTIRRRYLADLHAHTGRNTVLYASAFNSHRPVPDYVVQVTQQDIQGFMAALHGLSGDNLDLILHSPGGSLEAADQIVGYLRSKFTHVRAIIPQNAMSVATMIACACDEIVMGKHSALGPIDPQITFPTSSGRFTAPAQAILDEFEQARQEIIANVAAAPVWIGKLSNYPAGFLQICSNTVQQAKSKVADWLKAYMFRNDTEGAKRATAIGEWLGEAKNHMTHGRPISIGVARDQGLRVTALEDDQQLQERVLSVYHSTVLTFEATTCVKIVENHNGKGWYMNVNVEPAAGARKA